MFLSQKIIASLLIHCAIFAVIIYYNKINNNLNSITVKNHKNIKLSLIVNHKEQKKIFNNYNKKITINPKNYLKKKTNKQKIENNFINKFSNTKQFEKKEIKTLTQDSIIENNFIKKENPVQKNINPFGILKIPKMLLSQNLFPKKYYAKFILIKENNKIINFKFLGLTPTHEAFAYLDKTVQKAFYNQLQSISSEKIIFWLQIQQKQLDINEITKDSDQFSILLEFRETN